MLWGCRNLLMSICGIKKRKKTLRQSKKGYSIEQCFPYQLMQGAVQIMGVYVPFFLHSTNQKLLYFSLFNIQACPSFLNLNQTSSAYTKHRTILHGNDCCCQKETETSKVHLNINCFDLCVYV